MRKRLRKKLRRGEFAELGFEVAIQLHEELDEPSFNRFLDDLIDLVERYNLGIGGGGGPKRVSYIVGVLRGRGSVAPEQRDAVLEWLEGRGEVERVEASDLFDLWYPPRHISLTNVKR